MLVLAVDTSTQNLSYAVIKNGKVIYDYNRLISRGSGKLAYCLKKTFNQLSLKAKDFSFFLAGSGPGSFTGLRISFSLLKAFSLAAAKPVFCLNSFFACAYPFAAKKKKITVISDAKRSLIYAASFSLGSRGFSCLSGPKLVALNDCLQENKGDFFLTYDPVLRTKLLNLCPQAGVYQKDIYPKAKYLISGVKKSCFGKNYKQSLNEFKPLYLHPVVYKT